VITVFLPGALRPFAGGRDQIELGAGLHTVGEVLEAVARSCPGITDRVLTEGGAIREHVNIFVGAEAVRFTGGLATPVRDGDELSILPAVSGG
jgi:molybdopterin synthase sulfur carrier subunit